MAEKHVKFFLPQYMRDNAGKQNFLSKFLAVLDDCGFSHEMHSNLGAGLLPADLGEGYGVFYMEPANHPRGVTFRRNYFYPFWQIEKSAKRWEWPVATNPFDPDEIPTAQAKQFVENHRKRLFKDVPKLEARHLLVPLQGRLLMQRGFQPFSPIEMLTRLLDTVSEQVLATLHPNEFYNSAELAALEKLEKSHPHFKTQTGGGVDVVARARSIVTMNSSVALMGYFFGKPAMVLAKSDFPHIALDRLEQINQLSSHQPEFDKYLFWFLQQQSINAGRADVSDQIKTRLQRLGWQI